MALLHWLIAANGLCLAVGMAAIAGERGADSLSGFQIVFGVGWALFWAGVGLGLLRRWKLAWLTSLGLTGGSLLLLALVAGRNPLGAVCNGLMCAGILWILIARRDEFHRTRP